MKIWRCGLVITVGVAAAACAPVPTGPSVMVLAGPGKTLEQFQTDDRACRASASQELEKTKGGQVPPQRRYDIAYMQCMYAKGHQLPRAGEKPGEPSSSSAAVPPGTPQAAPLVWPPSPAQLECEASGGVWRAALDFCEFPSPEFPRRRWR